jgi:hypothetical protein
MARRRWLQFSLRGFLVVVTAFAVWFGAKANARHREYVAIKALRELGASCHYGSHRGNWPSWFIKALGDNTFKHAWSVEFHRCSSRVIGAEELGHLTHLPYLERVRFFDVHLTDDAVERLTTLDRIQFVSLSGTTASNNGKALLKATFPHDDGMPGCYQKAGYDPMDFLDRWPREHGSFPF